MIDTAEQHAAAALNKQVEYVDAKTAEAYSHYNDINSKLVGYVQTTIDNTNMAANKIASKISKAVETKLGNAYSYALDAGMIYPTNEEVYYQLHTKDFPGILKGDTPAPTKGAPPTPPPVPKTPPTIPPPTIPPVPAPAPHSEGHEPTAYCVYGADKASQLQAFSNLWKIDKPYMESNPGSVNDTGGIGPLAMNPGTDNFGWTWEERKIGIPATGGGWFEISVWVFPKTNISFMGAFDKPAPNNSIGWRGGCQPMGTCYFTNGEPLYPGCTIPPPTNPTPTPPAPVPPAPAPEPPPPSPPPSGPMPDSCPMPIPVSCGMFDGKRKNDPTGDPCLLIETIKDDTRGGDTFLSEALRAASNNASDPNASMVDRSVNNAIGRISQKIGAWVSAKLKSLADFASGGAGDPQGVALMTNTSYYMTVYNFFSRWFGFRIPQWEADLERRFNVAEQYKIPQAEEADGLYLAGKITIEQWRCFQTLDGQVLQWKEKGLEAKRNRINPQELTALYRRKMISDEQWKSGMRELGVVDREDADRYVDLQTAQPALQDTIRFMVRDVADETLVNKFQMDADFDRKWQGGLKEYGDALGVEPELAKYYWRAHWQLPSPTALNEMLHRLRPGRVAPELEVTETDVAEVLAQNDLLPYWINKQVAIGYNVMTRTDLVRAFQIRAIDEDELTEGFKDIGYNERDTEILVRFYVKQRTVQRAAKIGRTTPRTMINRYSKGIVTRVELRNYFDRLGYTRDEIDEVVDFADRERDYVLRAGIIAKVKKEYQSGMIGREDAISTLIDHQIGLEEANEFVDLWIPKSNSGKPIKFKEASAERLCKWRSLGIITGSQQLAALVRMGWTGADASRIVGECERDISEKETKELQKAADRAKREAAAAERKAKQDAKDKAAAAAKAKKDAASGASNR